MTGGTEFHTSNRGLAHPQRRAGVTGVEQHRFLLAEHTRGNRPHRETFLAPRTLPLRKPPLPAAVISPDFNGTVCSARVYAFVQMESDSVWPGRWDSSVPMPVARSCSFWLPCVIPTHQHSTTFLFLTAAWHSQHMHAPRFIELILFQCSVGAVWGGHKAKLH